MNTTSDFYFCDNIIIARILQTYYRFESAYMQLIATRS